MLLRRGQAHPDALRARVLLCADQGLRVGQIARRLCVSVSYVSKVLMRRRNTGVTTALPQRGHVPPRLSGLSDAIRARIKDKPDATRGAAGLAERHPWGGRQHRIDGENPAQTGPDL